MDLEVIWVRREQKYFCKRGWTSHFGKHEVICPSGKKVVITLFPQISRVVAPNQLVLLFLTDVRG